MNLTTLTIPVLTAGFFLAGLQPQAFAQEDPDNGIKPQHPASQRERQQNLIIEYYTPTKAPVVVLNNAMIGVYRGKPTHNGIMTSFQVFGESLLIQGSAGEMPETLSLVAQMDQNYVGAGEHTATTEEQFLYKLRYVSSNAVREALQSMDRNFMQQRQGQEPRGLSIGYVEERGVVLVRGTAAEVSKAKAILTELDVAPPNLMISCYLVQGKAGASTPSLPAALVRDLSALVPFEGFELLSSGMLPSDASSQLGLDVELEAGKGEFSLEMYPAAYDEDRGLLKLSSIKFKMSLYTNVSGKRERTQRSFSTSTSLATDKFTVLGAVGADPVFVVVRMTQLGN